MKNSKARVLSLVCVVLLFSSTSSWASDPVGIYGVVEKMVFEPDEIAPQRIQVWGVFALSDGKPGSNYLPPQHGYLYYSLTPGQEDICRKEWADLKSVAGTAEAIGFGLRYDSKSRLRQATDKVEAPDRYPIGVGVTKMGNRQHQSALLVQIRKTLQTQ